MFDFFSSSLLCCCFSRRREACTFSFLADGARLALSGPQSARVAVSGPGRLACQGQECPLGHSGLGAALARRRLLSALGPALARIRRRRLCALVRTLGLGRTLGMAGLRAASSPSCFRECCCGCSCICRCHPSSIVLALRSLHPAAV